MNKGRWLEFFADEDGVPISGASVAVRHQVTGELASIYTDVEGGDLKPNPFPTDLLGGATFCANPGLYRVEIATGEAGFELRDIYVFPAENRPVGEAAFMDVGTESGTVAAGDDPRFESGGGGISAYVIFNGDTAAILDSKGVSGVVRIQTGRYEVTLENQVSRRPALAFGVGMLNETESTSSHFITVEDNEWITPYVLPIRCQSSSGSRRDARYISVLINEVE